MNIAEIEAKVREFLLEELEIDEDKIIPEARLKEDMGIDSLEVVDIVVFVEKNFGFKMQAADFRNIATLQQFCEFVEQRMTA